MTKENESFLWALPSASPQKWLFDKRIGIAERNVFNPDEKSEKLLAVAGAGACCRRSRCLLSRRPVLAVAAADACCRRIFARFLRRFFAFCILQIDYLTFATVNISELSLVGRTEYKQRIDDVVRRFFVLHWAFLFVRFLPIYKWGKTNKSKIAQPRHRSRL
ncbi:MAG: hypothetical protein K5945_07555 [Bacteroidaceae bacterium]|nr:hypothetical protein [Bacteroidaceae bacterium]